MFKKEEIEFMKIYISLLYKYGYCYFDVRKEYLDEYLKQLENLVEYKKCFKKYSNLENIFKYDEIMDNYTNFINLILYVTNCPKYSFEDEKANIIMIKYDDKIIKKNLENVKYIDINIVNDIVSYMSDYINQNLKIKIFTK